MPAEATGQPRVIDGKQLYSGYCAPCHGENGDGNGPAARFLYPKPRNFGEGKFRLATTDNAIPSDDDLLRVVTRGMPGSAMFPFGHVREEDRRSLVEQVRLLIRTATEQQILRQAAERGDTVEPTELAQLVDDLTRPGEPITLPSDLPAPSEASVAHGREMYRKTCMNCHGEKGDAEGVEDQRDNNGMPTKPRDFTRGIFKGGREPRQLYARILRGMPGTPMPSSAHLSAADMGDLLNFVLSLSPPGMEQRVEHRRAQLVARHVEHSSAGQNTEGVWQGGEAAHIVVSPLWWRNYAEPDLHVAAVHDGQTLAVRLTWLDRTRDDRPVRPQDFEDMAAVQLFKGSPEPFLGMGQTDKPLDVWLWRAGWQAAADLDATYPNMSVDLYPFEKQKPGGHPHALENQPPDFLTARAAGNLHAGPNRDTTASNLQAGGFGTLTLRPRTSQVVRAAGTWKDGRWTIVLRRPLQVAEGEGIPLAPGDKLSIAFAIWDGSAGDRNGQKLISIWHDLQLE
jgi:mono/diheme cytochrome c family protein